MSRFRLLRAVLVRVKHEGLVYCFWIPAIAALAGAAPKPPNPESEAGKLN
jgi:hypothetical protein